MVKSYSTATASTASAAQAVESQHLASESFKTLYGNFNEATLDRLPEIYSEDVYFQDPITRIRGVEQLRTHFASTMNGLIACEFIFDSEYGDASQMTYEWRMKYAHKKLNRGRMLVLYGVSIVKFGDDSKVNFHRDYYDMGEMIYENAPILGPIVRFLKKRLSSD